MDDARSRLPEIGREGWEKAWQKEIKKRAAARQRNDAREITTSFCEGDRSEKTVRVAGNRQAAGGRRGEMDGWTEREGERE
jgi:hypothetical protein